MMKKFTLFLVAILFSSAAFAQTEFVIDYDGYDESEGATQGYTYERLIWPLNTDPNAGFGNMRWSIVDFNQLIVTQDGATYQTLPAGGDYTIVVDSLQLFYNFNPDVSVTADNDFTFEIYDFDDVARNFIGVPDEVANPVAGQTPLWSRVYTEDSLTVNATQLEVLTIRPNLALAQGQNFSVFMKNESDTLSALNLLMGYNENCGGGELGLTSAAPFNSTPYMVVNGVITPTLYTFGGGTLSCDQFIAQNTALVAFVSITANSFAVEAVSDQLLTETCPGSAVTLSANAFGGSGNYSYSWSPAGGLSSATGEEVIATVADTSTTYTLTVSDLTSGIDSTAEVTVLAFKPSVVAPGPEVVNLSCGQSTNINATATTQGTGFGLAIDTVYWSGGNANPLVTDVEGTYIATAINSAGCPAYDTVTVNVAGTNNVDFIIPGLLCSGEVITINNNSDRTAGWNFTWYITQSGDTVSSPGGETFIFQFTDPGAYQLTLVGDSANCEFSRTRSITINDGTVPPCFTSISDLDFNNLSVYPNPSNARLNVKFDLDRAQDVEITAYTVTGKQVAAQSFDASASVNTSINTSNLVEGVYILKIKTEQGVKTQRFVVEHN